MVQTGRYPKLELLAYIPLIIEQIGGKARPVDIKRYLDMRITPQTGFSASYNAIVKYCERLCDEGQLLRQVVLNNAQRVKHDKKRSWMISMYTLMPKSNDQNTN
ncbi:MAG: hypothetical protein HOH77_19290 [Candidatus Latescibacteria bacterium]|jgi:hypothetical protein|nr:hypothetical protein [Candidatus Latescibacterota bacterium]